MHTSMSLKHEPASELGVAAADGLVAHRSTWLIRISPLPEDNHRALRRVLLQGPGGALFLMSEVLLYATKPSAEATPSSEVGSYSRLMDLCTTQLQAGE